MTSKSKTYFKIGLFAFFVLVIIFAILFILNKSSLLSKISDTEIEQGWYYGSINQKKLGTPKQWVFCGNGNKSDMWVSSKEKCE